MDSGGTLASVEVATLTAIVGRLIPSDEAGPGAIEAHAVQYIDRALGGELAGLRDTYAIGLAAIDQYAKATHGEVFVRLPLSAQDDVLRDFERGVPTGILADSARFFALVREHTIQGTFCDPHYGGNANFIGWCLISYPGLRMMVTREEQRIGVRLQPLLVSAYDGDAYHHPESAAHARSGGHDGNETR